MSVCDDYSKCEPWNYEGSIWKTKSAFWTWCRGNVRQAFWSRHPIMTNFKNNACIPIPDHLKSQFNSNTKRIGKCCKCNEFFTKSNMEVDHITPTDGCKNYEEFHQFVDRMMMFKPDELALICKPCHKIKSYAEKEGVTFIEAKVEKEAIKLIKEKREKQFLTSLGITPLSNVKGRRKQVVDHLKELWG